MPGRHGFEYITLITHDEAEENKFTENKIDDCESGHRVVEMKKAGHTTYRDRRMRRPQWASYGTDQETEVGKVSIHREYSSRSR
jgi:hypothetical protein